MKTTKEVMESYGLKSNVFVKVGDSKFEPVKTIYITNEGLEFPVAGMCDKLHDELLGKLLQNTSAKNRGRIVKIFSADEDRIVIAVW